MTNKSSGTRFLLYSSGKEIFDDLILDEIAFKEEFYLILRSCNPNINKSHSNHQILVYLSKFSKAIKITQNPINTFQV